MATREIQFIISLPDTAGASGTTQSQRRAAHSHAARSAHAQVRRQRIKQYQAQKRREEHRQLEYGKALDELQSTFRPELLGHLPTHRKDPFMSLAKSLTPVEQMLFDHCTCSTQTNYSFRSTVLISLQMSQLSYLSCAAMS